MNFYIAISMALLCLPGCINRPKQQSDRIVQQRSAYDAIREHYQEPVELVARMNKRSEADDTRELVRKVREHVLMRSEEYNRQHMFKWLSMLNRYENLPYFNYKSVLDKNIEKLEGELAHQSLKNDQFSKQIKQLLEQLESLRRYIVISNEYAREQRTLALKGYDEEKAA